MADSVKVEYMGKTVIGASTYHCKDADAKDAIAPKPGDIAIVIDEGKIYFCVEQDNWLPFGGSD